MDRQTHIEKRLPPEELKHLNEMVLRAPPVRGPISALYRRCALKDRYGISLSAFHRYASRLREEIRFQFDAEEPADFNGRLSRLELPDDLRSQVEHAIVTRPKGLESVAKIHRHFRLRIHGVSMLRFERYARLTRWQLRLNTAGRIVNALFGEASLSRVGNKLNAVQLRLMAHLWESLKAERNGLETEELLQFSRILAEQQTAVTKAGDLQLKERKLDAQLQPQPSAPPPKTGLPSTAPLPPNFDEVVKEVYGVDVSDVAPAREGPSAPAQGERSG